MNFQHTLLLKSLSVTACLLAATTLSAQTSRSRDERAGASADHSHARASHTIDVYECDCVDTPPRFPGGEVAMMSFINRERRYPPQAYRDGIEGRVRCSFVVNKDGRLSHISVIKGVEQSIDREAVRIISEMPAWEAGELNSAAVPVYYILSIPFRK